MALACYRESHKQDDGSRRTCEVYGEPDGETGQEWIRTLCPDRAQRD
ncbi:hypothetical protein GCM10009527_033380 [Actinomadura nitritigenes]